MKILSFAWGATNPGRHYEYTHLLPLHTLLNEIISDSFEVFNHDADKDVLEHDSPDEQPRHDEENISHWGHCFVCAHLELKKSFYMFGVVADIL